MDAAQVGAGPVLLFLETERIDAAAWLAAAEAWLDARERARLLRFIPLDRRLELLLGRVLVRSWLALARGLEDVRIVQEDESSKPRLARPDGSGRGLPAFNISHSQGAVALVLGPEGSEVGIDVERIRPVKDDLVAYTMQEDERAQIVSPEAFFRCWTAKEAYMKLVGSGLAIPPRRLRVDLARATVTDRDAGEARPFRSEVRGAWALAWMADEARGR